MGVHTTLSELQLSNNALENLEKRASVEKELKQHLAKLKFSVVEAVPPDDGSVLLFFTGEKSSHAVVRVYKDGLLTIDVTEYVPNDCVPFFSEELMSEFTSTLKNSLEGKKEKCLPAIRRGQTVQRYFPTTENLLIEYDFDVCVFEADSEYQNIKIMHSHQFGNMLILDDDPNLAESDLAYTQAITGYGHEEYAGKTVLVLGGGDGGILHELLKARPTFITMVDIDGIVVSAAAKHLRGICYDSLDALKGSNYEVLIADCVPILEDYVKNGTKFDYVINDLTAIPCTTEPVGDHWNFLRLILDLSMKVLAPTGKYYTQGNGANMKSALAMYEKQLDQLHTPVRFRTKTVCVPSYHEMWVFYEMWKKTSGSEEKNT